MTTGLAKRARLEDIGEAQEHDIPVTSIETDVGAEQNGVDFTEDQSPRNVLASHGQVHDENRSGSGSYGQPSRNDIVGTRRFMVKAGSASRQVPITPPSDFSAGRLGAVQQHPQEDRSSRAPVPRATSASSRKFKNAHHAELTSDIDDSQMSPRSKSSSFKERQRNAKSASMPRTSRSPSRRVSDREVQSILQDAHILESGKKRARNEVPLDFSLEVQGLSADESNVLSQDSSPEKGYAPGKQQEQSTSEPTSSETEGSETSKNTPPGSVEVVALRHLNAGSGKVGSEVTSGQLRPRKSSTDESNKENRGPTSRGHRLPRSSNGVVGDARPPPGVETTDSGPSRKKPRMKKKSTVGDLSVIQDSDKAGAPPDSVEKPPATGSTGRRVSLNAVLSKKARVSDTSMIDSPGEQLSGELQAWTQHGPSIIEISEALQAEKGRKGKGARGKQGTGDSVGATIKGSKAKAAKKQSDAEREVVNVPVDAKNGEIDPPTQLHGAKRKKSQKPEVSARLVEIESATKGSLKHDNGKSKVAKVSPPPVDKNARASSSSRSSGVYPDEVHRQNPSPPMFIPPGMSLEQYEAEKKLYIERELKRQKGNTPSVAGIPADKTAQLPPETADNEDQQIEIISMPPKVGRPKKEAKVPIAQRPQRRTEPQEVPTRSSQISPVTRANLATNKPITLQTKAPLSQSSGHEAPDASATPKIPQSGTTTPANAGINALRSQILRQAESTKTTPSRQILNAKPNKPSLLAAESESDSETSTESESEDDAPMKPKLSAAKSSRPDPSIRDPSPSSGGDDSNGDDDDDD